MIVVSSSVVEFYHRNVKHSRLHCNFVVTLAIYNKLQPFYRYTCINVVSCIIIYV